MKLFRKRYVPTPPSSEADRRSAEAERNASRLLGWFAVSRTRAMLADIDRAVSEAFPGAPTLLSGFDEMRRWR